MTRRVLVDLQAAQSPGHWDRGVARWTKEHARALLRRDLVAGLLLNPNLPFPRSLDRDLLASPLLRWNTQTEVRRITEAELAAGNEAPAYLISSPFEISAWAEGDVSAHLLRGDVPVALVLYDLIPLQLADQYLADRDYAIRYRTRIELLHQVDLVLTISEHTRRDALRLLDLDPTKVVAVGTGVPAAFRPPAPGERPLELVQAHLPVIERPYAIWVTGNAPHKNNEGLVRAWAELPESLRRQHQLVLTCNVDEPTARRWVQVGLDAGLDEGDVVVTGFVSEELLHALVRGARLAVVPSLQEGYGMPVAEAVASGTPAVSSNVTSLPEILDLPDATFDPADPADIARVVARGLTDGELRARILSRAAERLPDMTWDAVAGRSAAAIAAVEPPVGGVVGSTRTRVALAGPMPPTPSGIADYNLRLLPALAARADVDVFTDVPRPGYLPHNVGWFPYAALERNKSPWSYDAVVFTAGNSDHHHRVYDLAHQLPGVLWLHDVRLPGLLTTYALAGKLDPADAGPRFLWERLVKQYRRRLPIPFLRQPVQPLEEYVAQGIGMTQELVDMARAVVVSSELAERLLRLDQPADASLPPVSVLPLAFPEPWGDDTQRRSVRRPLIACFGVVAPVKGVEVLIGSLAALRARGVDASLALVGHVDDGYRDHLVGLARSAEVADSMVVTGRVDPATYQRWQREATVAVQLRLGTNGEASAAVTDCLAAGIPTITNVAGDLPTGAVHELAWDADAVTVADAVAALLSDAGARAGLSAAGRDAAAAWGFAQVAEQLLAVVRSL